MAGDEHGPYGDDCTVILPTYNEEANIGRMIGCLKSSYPSFRIVVMDDNSSDMTQRIVKDMAERDGGIRLVVRERDDKGLAASILQGIMETGTEYFVNMDSDFQHPVSSVGGIYRGLKAGSDLCIGVRSDRTALSFGRWMASWTAHAMAAFTLKFNGKRTSRDVMSGLFGGRTSLFKEVIVSNGEGFDRKGFKALFDLMKYAPSDITVSETDFEFGERAGGESKISSGVIVSVIGQCGAPGRLAARILGRIL